MKITSVQNPRIKAVVALRKAGARREQGLAIVEGFREIAAAVAAGIEVESAFYCPGHSTQAVSTSPVATEKLTEVTESVFEKMACREHPDGWLALVRPRILALAEVKLSGNPLVVVLEGVEKPGNLGAILRTADAAAADAVIVCDPATDVYNHNVIRSSLGCVFSRQVVTCGSAEAIAWLKERGIGILAATPDGSIEYSLARMKGPVAIAMGTEADGLSGQWLSAADQKIRIVMRGAADSLNVSTACAILVFEALRQRGA